MSFRFPNGDRRGHPVSNGSTWSFAPYFTDIRQLRFDDLDNEECLVNRPSTPPFQIAGHQFIVQAQVTRTTYKFHLKVLTPGALMIKTTVGIETGMNPQTGSKVNVFRLTQDGQDNHKIYTCRKGPSSIILNFKLELLEGQTTYSAQVVTWNEI